MLGEGAALQPGAAYRSCVPTWSLHSCHAAAPQAALSSAGLGQHKTDRVATRHGMSLSALGGHEGTLEAICPGGSVAAQAVHALQCAQHTHASLQAQAHNIYQEPAASHTDS